MSEPERTADGRHIIVAGRRWRAQDPDIPEDAAAELRRNLGKARSAVRSARRAEDDAALAAARTRVGICKHGLGERGEPWWEQDAATRERRWRTALDRLGSLDSQ